MRSAHAVFSCAVLVGPPTSSTSTSSPRAAPRPPRCVSQNGCRAITVTALLDVPTDDVIRHQLSRPEVAAPADANDRRCRWPGGNCGWSTWSTNSPDEVGPPELYAWLHYDPIPARDDLAKALIAYFTGHLGISTTMRAHEGIGTSQSHLTVSTAPLTVTVSFHEPVHDRLVALHA